MNNWLKEHKYELINKAEDYDTYEKTMPCAWGLDDTMLFCLRVTHMRREKTYYAFIDVGSLHFTSKKHGSAKDAIDEVLVKLRISAESAIQVAKKFAEENDK